MEIMHIHVKVKPDAVEAFMDSTRRNAEATRAEPGNLRCDVVQSLTDPTVFMMLEAFRDAPAKEAHFKTEHFTVWQSEIGDLLEDSTVTGCRPVSPELGHWD